MMHLEHLQAVGVTHMMMVFVISTLVLFCLIVMLLVLLMAMLPFHFGHRARPHHLASVLLLFVVAVLVAHRSA